ncbi:hypothetical protein BGZ51_006009 [Haplosporangium sp. Z 767]|nr:hypothetical protein BGZ51_006009 [Haplosporangium sp. Z 767]KAF9196908.1 hypothetical protein BGZ50_004493 [Haplosporangium sp. Z 11]
METSSIKRNPLHIPEIRSRISRFVSVKDAVSCVRVSKDWSKDFAFPIWYSIDFKIHNSFVQLHDNVITKNGHHIRIVKNLETQAQLNALLRPTIVKVQVLELICAASARFRALCLDLILNNNRSLEKLTLDMDQDATQDDYSSRMVSIISFIPVQSVSKLTTLRLYGACCSRNSFASFLRHCPLLTTVDLQCGVALFSSLSIDTFQHTGVTTLVAPIEQVFKPDPESELLPLGSTLLVHFPNLIEWTTYLSLEESVVPIERIKTETRMCCPKVNQIDTWTTPHDFLYGLIAKVFYNLASVEFAYEQLSMDIVLALLFHKATLFGVSTTFESNKSAFERDELPVEVDHFQGSARALQLLPRSCPNLTTLNLEPHQMDMDFVEEEVWVCKGLRRLRVRILGLDTKEKVDRTLQLWVDGRRKNTDSWREEHGKENEEEGEEGTQSAESHLSKTEDMSIEMRVARHLLKFKQLNAVWLGTRTRYAEDQR